MNPLKGGDQNRRHRYLLSVSAFGIEFPLPNPNPHRQPPSRLQTLPRFEKGDNQIVSGSKYAPPFPAPLTTATTHYSSGVVGLARKKPPKNSSGLLKMEPLLAVILQGTQQSLNCGAIPMLDHPSIHRLAAEEFVVIQLRRAHNS